MANPRDLAHVRACLDDPFTPHLLALADWHEEAGQGALARTYRRIAEEGKVPAVRRAGAYRWEAPLHAPALPSEISVALLGVMQGWRPTVGYDYNESPTLSGAYLLLAQAISQACRDIALACDEEEGP